MTLTFLSDSTSSRSVTLRICLDSSSDNPVNVLALTVFAPSLPVSAAALLAAALADN